MRQVLDLADLDSCQVAALSEHFGESLDAPCGHCSWCLDGQQQHAGAPRRTVSIDDATWTNATALRTGQHAALFAEPRTLARFLCGVGSPALSRARMQRHPLFGALAQVSFEEVLTRASRE